jgi:hypothetical protein
MTPFNPISGAALPAAQAQQQLATDKTRQIRREQAARRNIATAIDHFEHAVENAEAVAEIHDEQQRQTPDRRKDRRRSKSDKGSDEEPPHLDVVG